MTKCATCNRVMVDLPPSLQDFQEQYPGVSPRIINRSVPRCRRCEYMEADRRAMDAELPPPSHINVVDQIEQDMNRAGILIAQGAGHPERLNEALTIMRQKLNDAKKMRDEGIQRAMLDFMAIWGSWNVV